MQLGLFKRLKMEPPGTLAAVAVRRPMAAPEVELLFLEAYGRLHGPLKDRAGRSLDADDAADAAAETVAILWERWPTLSPEQRNDRFAFGILRRCILARLRTARRFVSLDDAEAVLEELAVRADADAIQSYEDAARADALGEILDGVLAVMPPRRREVLLLVREQSFTYKEAAEVLGLREGSINTHIHLATKQLRAAFTRAGYRIPAPWYKQLLFLKRGEPK